MVVRYNDDGGPIVKCEWCGEEFDNNESSEVFYCERCGRDFCRDCWMRKFGWDKYWEMYDMYDRMVCVDHYEEETEYYNKKMLAKGKLR